MPRPGRLYERKPKLVKVESRSKVNFDYAETRTYIWAQAQIGQSREQKQSKLWLCRDQDVYMGASPNWSKSRAEAK